MRQSLGGDTFQIKNSKFLGVMFLTLIFNINFISLN